MAAMLATGLRYLPRCVRRFSSCRSQFTRLKVVKNVEEEISSGSGRACALLLRCHGTLAARFRGDTVANVFQQHRGFRCSAIACEEFKIVPVPTLAESISEGDVKWLVGVGDFVKTDQTVAEVETDKINVSVNTPAAGVIVELFVPDGEKVKTGEKLFKLKVSDAPPSKEEAAPSRPSPPPPPPPPSAKPAAPSVSTSHPAPSAPPPVPPVPSKPQTSVPTSSVKPTPASSGALPPVGGARTEQRVKMNRMRQRIAQRLKDAQNTCAMLTTFNEVDMSNVMEMRNKYKDPFQKKFGLKLGFMSAFVKATAFALQDQPVVNAVIDEQEIVYRDYIDISVAVATPKGLVVPVIRNVEGMNYADIEKVIAELGEKARAGTLAIEDMDGGTFTISNGGVFGSMFGTPIINPPQSAILGMHAIFDRPVAVGGKVEIRPMMYIALTYDHRLIDGREAVLFLRKIKSAVEDPRVLLLDL